MPRPRSASHDDTRKRLLAVARGLVLAGGYEKLSLREIARKGGFGPASLYEYFDGKDAIVRALAAESGASLRLALVAAAGRAAPSRAQLVRLGRAYVEWALENREDFLLLFSRLPSQRTSLEDGPSLGSPFRVVLEAVAGAAGAGVIRAEGPTGVEQRAYALWALAHGMASLQLTHLAGFDADFDAADERAFEALVRGWSA